MKLSKKFPSYDNKPASITIDNKDFAREQIRYCLEALSAEKNIKVSY